MKKKLLLRPQMNELFMAVRERGLDPSEFRWEERESDNFGGQVSALVHLPTDYFFIFDYHSRYLKPWSWISPGRDSSLESKYAASHQEQVGQALEWLDCLKREIETPDLWSAISQERKLAEAASDPATANTPFTLQEQENISARLKEVERYVLTAQNLSQEQAEFVRKRLDYLAEAASRMGRQDWIHTTIGVIFTIVVSVGLAPDEARELLRFVANTLSHLLGGVLPLP